MSKNTFMYVLLLSEIIGLVVSHSYLALVFALAENFDSAAFFVRHSITGDQ